MIHPPYTLDTFMQVAELPNEPDRKLALGMFVRFCINDAVFRYRNRFHKEPTRINLSFEEFEAIIHFTLWCDEHLPKDKQSRVDESFHRTPITQVKYWYDGIPVVISNKPVLLE